MPINFPSRQELDSQLRTTTIAVRTALDNVAELKALLDGLTDEQLTGVDGGYQYTAGDLANIRSTFNDLAQLRLVATGAATQANATDFFTFPRRVWGFNPARR